MQGVGPVCPTYMTPSNSLSRRRLIAAVAGRATERAGWGAELVGGNELCSCCTGRADAGTGGADDGADGLVSL